MKQKITSIEEALEAEKQGRLVFLENGPDGTGIKISQSLVHAVSGWIEQGVLVWKPETVELVEWACLSQRKYLPKGDDLHPVSGWKKTGRIGTLTIHEVEDE